MVGALMLMKMEMGHLSVMEGTAHWAGSSYKKAVENDFLQSPQPTSFEKLSFRLPHQQENLIYSSIWCAHRGKKHKIHPSDHVRLRDRTSRKESPTRTRRSGTRLARQSGRVRWLVTEAIVGVVFLRSFIHGTTECDITSFKFYSKSCRCRRPPTRCGETRAHDCNRGVWTKLGTTILVWFGARGAP